MRRLNTFLVVAGVVALGLGARVSEGSSAGFWNPYVESPLLRMCVYCEPCAVGHEFVEDTDLDHPKWGANHGCYITNCNENNCEHSDEDVATKSANVEDDRDIGRLLVDVKAGDLSAVTTLMKDHGDVVTVNRERGAIQVFARCAGKAIVAHVPLNAAQLDIANYQ